MSLTISPARIVEQSASPLLVAPPSWSRYPLGDLATIVNGCAFKSKQFVADGGTPLIRIRDLFNDHTAVGFAGDYEDRYVVQPGELLVGMDGDFNCVRWRGPKALLNQRVCKIVPNPAELDLDFLTLLLPGYLKAIHEATSSTTVTHLSSRDVAMIPIPLPPLSLQRQLSSLLGSAELLRRTTHQHLNAAKQATERFRQAVLAAGCTGRLTADWREERGLVDSPGAPASWELTTFGDVCARVTVGHVGKMVNEYREVGVPFLRSQNVRELRFDPAGLKFISPTFNRHLKNSTLHPGDIVVVRSGFVGTACVIPPELEEANCSDLVIARPGSRLVAEFGAIYINSPGMKAHVSDVKVGSAQAHFNTRAMVAAPIYLPPRDEQNEIVKRVGRLLELSDHLITRVSEAMNRLGRSEKAILAKALRGELESIGGSR